MSTRPRVRSVTPLLVVSDLQRAIDFYSRSLGFGEPSVHGDPPCFAMLNRDGFDLFLSLAESPDQVAPHGPHGTWDVYIHVADIAAEIEAIRSVGTAIDKGPRDAFYPMREIECLDPDGHRICLAQDIGGEPFRVAEVWEGVLDVGAAKLRLALKLTPSQGGLVGRLDSPDQQAMNMPIDSVTLDGLSLRFEMKALQAAMPELSTKAGGCLRASGRSVARSGRWSFAGSSRSCTDYNEISCSFVGNVPRPLPLTSASTSCAKPVSPWRGSRTAAC